MAGEHANFWAALVMLGAFHGINPAMGWLFALALGLQEHRRTAVFRALLPLALGHTLAIAGTILVAIFAGFALPLNYLRCGRGRDPDCKKRSERRAGKPELCQNDSRLLKKEPTQ